MERNSIIVDFNNLAFRCAFAKEVSIESPLPEYGIWRFMVTNAIYDYMCNIGNIKEVIIAIDDVNSWRKSYFPRYKESRKKKREVKKEIDWSSFFNEIDKLTRDYKHYLPFSVLKVKGAEADDVIAILSTRRKGKSVVISNDEDYLQLCSENIKIWNPNHKDYVTVPNVEEFITIKCLTGQAKDDIFNVKTSSDWGNTKETEGKRKPGFGPKSAEKVLKSSIPLDEWLKSNKDTSGVLLSENFKRNKVLIDFNCIPKTIEKRIINAYNNNNFPPPENIYKFFKENNFRGFLDNFTIVERKFLELY